MDHPISAKLSTELYSTDNDGQSARTDGQCDSVSEEEGEEETESSSPPLPPSSSAPNLKSKTFNDAEAKSSDTGRRGDLVKTSIGTSDENSSSSTDSDDELEIDCQLSLEQQLEQFRLQWRREIRGIGDNKDESPASNLRNEALHKEQEKEQEALFLYRQGVREEKRGNMYSAVMMYRRSMQLVPEIESRVPELRQMKHSYRRRRRTSSGSQGGSTSEQEANPEAAEAESNKAETIVEEDTCVGDRESCLVSALDSDDVNARDDVTSLSTSPPDEGVGEEVPEEPEEDVIPPGVTLIQHIATKRLNSEDPADKKSCSPFLSESQGGCPSTHFSDLPPEIILYILQWVISEDCDVRSVERVSAVSRGFYLLARDPDLWKLLCQKMWTVDCVKPKVLGYTSWRHMYLRRPHPLFDGIYISKTSYIRQGERSLLDTYRHWQLVEYFRYIRLFSDGFMFMLTTCDDPITTVPKIKNKNTKYPGLLTGYYRTLEGEDGAETITAILTRSPATAAPFPRKPPGGRGNRGANIGQDHGEQSFHLELVMTCTGKKRLHSSLKWQSYAVHTRHPELGKDSVSPFDLKPASYPDLYFSRVKSYSSVSIRPLKLGFQVMR